MNRLFKRGLLAGLPVVAVAFAAVGGVAYACTNLASLNLGTPSGVAGTSVPVTGSSFAPGSPVVLHWNSTTGSTLASVNPSADGAIAATVKVPASATPGEYVIVATEAGKTGPAFGTPARSSFEVLGAGATTAPAASNASAALSTPAPVTSGVSSGLIALTAVLGVVGLGLFGFGAASYGRQRRRAAVPARAPVDKS